MTQANNEPSGQDNLNRTLRSFDRRIIRLEESQVTGRELDRDFNQVFAEIDEVKASIQQLQIGMDKEFDELKSRFGELERKFDIVMSHITGNGS